VLIITRFAGATKYADLPLGPVPASDRLGRFGVTGGSSLLARQAVQLGGQFGPFRERTAMLTTNQVLDLYFLDTRCMLIEIAALLDRYDRAAASGGENPAAGVDRLDRIYQALTLLAERDTTANRSERLLNLFSDLP
jgi:hypothetical protein